MQPDNESQRTLGLSLFSRMRTPQKKVEASSQMLTEAAAWREIARRIVEGEWKGFGLCREIHILLLAEDKILRDVASAMFLHLGTYLDYGWAYTPGEEREARALAALWLALDAEEEPVMRQGGGDDPSPVQPLAHGDASWRQWEDRGNCVYTAGTTTK